MKILIMNEHSIYFTFPLRVLMSDNMFLKQRFTYEIKRL